MGTDTPLAVLSEKPQLLYGYFKQLFAQVTNPPVDAIREEIIMAIETAVGPEGNLLEPEPESCRQLELPTPVLTNEDLERIRALDGGPGAKAVPGHHAADALPGVGRRRRAAQGPRGPAVQASEAIAEGYNLLILSDRGHDAVGRAHPGAAGGLGGAPPPHPRGHAHARAASCSSRASRARCTTSRCSSATAPAP